MTFLDADDMLMAESLEDRLMAFLQMAPDPHVAGAFCGVKNVPESATWSALPKRMSWQAEFGDKRLVDFVSADGECPFSAHAPLIRTDLLLALGGFDESMQDGAEDWDLWLRVLRNGYTFVPAKFRTAAYRQKAGSMIKNRAIEHALSGQRADRGCRKTGRPSLT